MSASSRRPGAPRPRSPSTTELTPTDKNIAKANAKKMESRAYAVFLEELADTVRQIEGLGPHEKVFGLQDGAKFHWGPEAKAAIVEKLMQLFVDFPAYSQDLNPIENLFSILDDEMAKLAVKCPAKGVKGTIERARRLVERIGKTDYIENMISSMPNRLRLVIKAKGGPTRY